MSILPITDAFTRYRADERHSSPYPAQPYRAALTPVVDLRVTHPRM